MSITFDILGAPGRDNALLVRIDSGQSITRLLFDCGDGCLNSVGFSEIQLIDHLLFSHLHMDHIGGFDYFFRCVFNRDTKPNLIWGPSETGRIMQHRFQGFRWNLQADMSDVAWRVNDISTDEISATRCELAEAFAIAHHEGHAARQPVIIDGLGYAVEAHVMNHRIPSIAYVVREKTRRNIDTSRLGEMGLQPGPWLQLVKDRSDITESLTLNGVAYSLASLRETLIVETPGESIAYLTDFLLDEEDMARLAVVLRGCGTIICEGQYRHADLDLARRNYHMTTTLAARLAKRAGTGKLILFHLSDRYGRDEWLEMLREAREEFPAASYPRNWRLDTSK